MISGLDPLNVADGRRCRPRRWSFQDRRRMCTVSRGIKSFWIVRHSVRRLARWICPCRGLRPVSALSARPRPMRAHRSRPSFKIRKPTIGSMSKPKVKPSALLKDRHHREHRPITGSKTCAETGFGNSDVDNGNKSGRGRRACRSAESRSQPILTGTAHAGDRGRAPHSIPTGRLN